MKTIKAMENYLEYQERTALVYMMYYLATNGSTFVPDTHYLTLLEEKFGEDRLSIKFVGNGFVARLV